MSGKGDGKGYESAEAALSNDISTFWLKIAKGETIPETAVVAGTTKTDGRNWVGRIDGEAGKINADGLKMCHFYGHSSKCQDAAEILCCTSRHAWISVKTGTQIPANALKVGETKSDGVTYVGRLQGEVGKINTDTGKADGKMNKFWAHNFWRGKHECEIFVVQDLCASGCGRFAFQPFTTCCSHCKGAEGPHATDCASKNAVQDANCGMKGTVICVAGLASAALEMRENGSEAWDASYCHIGTLLANPKKFLDSLKLRLTEEEMEDGSKRTCVEDAEGVEFRPYAGIDGLSMLNPCEIRHYPPVAVWKGLVDELIKHYNPVGFNYDWRKWGCPRYSHTLPEKFRVLIEAHFKTSGPVTVVGHSMGGPVSLYCLSVLGAEWQKKYVKDYILVAPAPMGAVVMVPSYSNNPITAMKALFHAPRFLEHGVADTTVTWAGMASEMPMLVGGLNTHPDYPIVLTSTKEYYVQDIGDFLKLMGESVPGRDFATRLWPSISEISSAMQAPAVKTSIIYDNGQPTPSQVSWIDAQDDLKQAPKITKYEPGDNTVIASSVESMGNSWIEAGADVRFFNTPDQVDHKNLIVGKYTIQTILDILEGKNVAQRTLASSFSEE